MNGLLVELRISLSARVIGCPCILSMRLNFFPTDIATSADVPQKHSGITGKQRKSVPVVSEMSQKTCPIGSR